VADKLRKAGDGSLSQGIIKAAAKVRRSIIERDVEIQRLEKLSVDLREDYLHMMRKVRHARDLLSGEFYNEALGELTDALGCKND
jgi:hypothetical protein